jgi:hypothetical protein
MADLFQKRFVWLLNDTSFTDLVSKKMPDNIIFNALYVIETYTKKSFATAFKNDKDISLVKKLIDMIQSPPLSMAKDKVKKYRMRVCLF